MINAAEALPAPGRVQPIYLEGKLLPLQAQIAADLQLQDGQVVQAMVRSYGGELSLLLKGKLVEAKQLSQAQVGSSMWLRVSERADGSWGLLPLARGVLPAAGEPLVSRIASLLYRPPGSADLLDLLGGPALSGLMQTLARPDLQAQWRAMQLSLSQLTPEALRAALLGAMGSEVALARGRGALANDPKQFLRKLLDALDSLDESGSELSTERSHIERAIDNLEANQVQSVQAQAQREVMFSMILPFVDGAPVELVFRRAPREAGDAPVITVNVHTRNEQLGALWLQTRLTGTEQVDLMMWALQGDVAMQARNRQAELETELRQSGLKLQSFQVVHGARPATEADWSPSGRGLVVDISA